MNKTCTIDIHACILFILAVFRIFFHKKNLSGISQNIDTQIYAKLNRLCVPIMGQVLYHRRQKYGTRLTGNVARSWWCFYPCRDRKKVEMRKIPQKLICSTASAKQRQHFSVSGDFLRENFIHMYSTSYWVVLETVIFCRPIFGWKLYDCCRLHSLTILPSCGGRD